ncbi:MAG: (Fe-S)-binding protein [Sphingobacteriaceae bacterium]|nr:(Fe-S)-binding protein [Cytophagaceae bacterium]
MLGILQQALFIIALVVTGFFVARRVGIIAKTINLGRDEDRSDQPGERLKIMLLVAFGQKKMFANPTVALLHLVIYLGFIIINVEILEIILDGILGSHRLFAPYLGGVYPFLINVFEILAFGVLVTCIAFLARRWVTKVSRLQPERHRELRRWPVTDATLILGIEIFLMVAFLTWNASDGTLRQRGVAHYNVAGVPDFFISQWLMPAFKNWSTSGLIAYERIAWWAHILGIFAFAVYVTYSKHLHIVIAFPNVYFSRLIPKGEMQNMPEVTTEVKIMLGLAQPETPPADAPETPAPGKFGAKDVMDLSWKNLMEAYSCTECGRCTAACPANLTGKKLSPRKIMMDTRDRLEDVGRNLQTNGGSFKDDGKTLLGDYILDEELRACTSCNACVQECPVNINPLDIIYQLRRYRVMEESLAPGQWNAMFSNLENNQAPWKFSPADRFNWADGLK